ncbi:PhoH phosphate starvation-inducible protein [Vibrio phage nt-1]|uniref:PhoH phosphate starvation-inducible protein n=1 Tax=Vibrio phage nt-1 TaxID=115992 RepID=R9TGV5_9CAUD|nr:PhoH-like phosphate starvation-inducible [Vibrio phage nt-1]AGN30338.1 PhoH phosphate starvation-inducible protein [Vibrio phage nt-1]
MGKKKKEERTIERVELLTFNQEQYAEALWEDVADDGSGAFVFAIGSAGTGKTWLATTLGADMYSTMEYTQFIILKPTLSCGEELGYLPGTLEEKMEPWIQTVTQPLKDRLGADKFKCDWNKRIHAEPIQFVRGKTFDNCFIVVDEAQNLTKTEIQTIMTRIGENTKMVFCGDLKQDDHKMIYRTGKKEVSGLAWMINEIRMQQRAGIEIIEFTNKDVVRSGACKLALDIIDKADD